MDARSSLVDATYTLLVRVGEMLLVRHIIASSANHCRAVLSPHATVLNTLYATLMLQQEVPCEQRASLPYVVLGRGRVILSDVIRLFELCLCLVLQPVLCHPC